MNENDKTEKYKEKLSTDFPELDIKTVKVIASGWHHDAIEVNNSVIFRIPRGVHDTGAGYTVSNEVEILKRLKDKLPVHIPDPLYVAPKEAYFGYPKLEGVLLESLVPKLSRGDWTQLMAIWVDIASAIHREVPVKEARSLNIPDFEGSYPGSAERIFNLPNLDENILDFARETIQDVRGLDMKKQHVVFIHNDLQFHNILADPTTRKVSGLIDWTDVCIAPIAREFAIPEWTNSYFLEQATSLYKQKTGVNVDVDQARMWRSLEELGDYVEEVEANELDEAEDTLRRIEKLMSFRK